MMTKTGTVAFSAPEIFNQREYDEKVDIWSAGIVLYMMLCGHQPFHCDNIPKLVLMITTSNLPQMKTDLAMVSFDAFNLVEQMLSKDPTLRPSAKAILEHPWLTEEMTMNTMMMPRMIKRPSVLNKATENLVLR